MMGENLCPYKKFTNSSNVCPYKKGFFGFHKTISGRFTCLVQDKKDYQGFNNNSWLGQKLKFFYNSTCPMVSSNWWKNRKVNSKK
jgi:hypothetical protein